MASPIQGVRRLGQSIWLDYIRRNLVTSGELKKLVQDGISGLTSNPTIFQKAIAQSNDYDEALRALLKANQATNIMTLYERLTIEDIRMAADILRPVYDASDGIDGFVSLEVSPHLAYDTMATTKEVMRLWRLVARPNLMIKVPATPQGIPAIETLVAEGVNINATLMFSRGHYEAVSRAYIRGLARTLNPQRIASVASFFVSRVDTYVDRELQRIGTEGALALRGRVAIANSKLVYQRSREVFLGEEFARERKRGARVQRVLWGSTSTKNPNYSDVMYVEGLIGPDTVNTLPLETINAFQDHGRVHRTLDEGLEAAEEVLGDLGKMRVDLGSVTEQLQRHGVKAFADSFDQLLSALSEKRRGGLV